MNAGDDAKIEVRLMSIRYAARDINLFEFSRLDGDPLPVAEPGAHIDLHLGADLVRQYSLLEPGKDLSTYTIAIKREAQGRGGSRHAFDELKVGDTLTISQPRNHFRLCEGAPHSILIAGGIGITPIHAMVRRLVELGRTWELYYACRGQSELPALDILSPGPRVNLHIDDQSGGSFLDIEAIVAAAPPEAHLYCCGPAPMLAAFEAAAKNRPADQVHVEHFSAKEDSRPIGGFTVRLARSDREFVIPPGQTILGVLRQAGMNVSFSCEEGVCGACETAVIFGVPDHRDSILTEKERAANDTMMICCGGAASDLLVLDL